jgi:hypothetical protein
VRRAAVVLGIVAILASSCGGSNLPARLAATLQDRVAQIRSSAEDGRLGIARTQLRGLVELVISRLEAGRIDEGRATEILEAAEAVAEQLGLVPRTVAPESLSPSPSEGDEGEGQGNDQGNDKDKDKGKGHGDEGHGNDD